MTSDELLRLAATAEQYSEHPLAKAIVDHAKERGIAVPDLDGFKNDPGYGIVAELEGRTLLVGSHALLAKNGMTVSTGAATAVFVAEKRNSQWSLLGRIEMSDPIKEDSRDAIARLRAMKMKLLLLSGDQREHRQNGRRVGRHR